MPGFPLDIRLKTHTASFRSTVPSRTNETHSSRLLGFNRNPSSGQSSNKMKLNSLSHVIMYTCLHAGIAFSRFCQLRTVCIRYFCYYARRSACTPILNAPPIFLAHALLPFDHKTFRSCTPSSQLDLAWKPGGSCKIQGTTTENVRQSEMGRKISSVHEE